MKLEAVHAYFNRLPEALRMEVDQRTSPVSEFLYRLIVDNQIQNVLEIGTFKGKNSLYMGAACEETGGTLYTINISRDELAVAHTLISGAGLTNVVLCLGDSLAAIPVVQQQCTFEMAFIDGHHSYRYAFREFQLIEAALQKEKGIIIFDDAAGVHVDAQGDGGVPRAVEEAQGQFLAAGGTVVGVCLYGSAQCQELNKARPSGHSRAA